MGRVIKGGATAVGVVCCLLVMGCNDIVGLTPGTPRDTGTGGTGGTETTSGGPPRECSPSEADGAVTDECGIFVSSSGADSNAGTKDKPLRTLAAAIAKAADSGKPVYACN